MKQHEAQLSRALDDATLSPVSHGAVYRPGADCTSDSHAFPASIYLSSYKLRGQKTLYTHSCLVSKCVCPLDGIPWLALLCRRFTASPPGFILPASSWYLICKPKLRKAWATQTHTRRYRQRRARALTQRHQMCWFQLQTPEAATACCSYFIHQRSPTCSATAVCFVVIGGAHYVQPSLEEAVWCREEMTCRQPEVVWAQSCSAALAGSLCR